MLILGSSFIADVFGLLIFFFLTLWTLDSEPVLGLAGHPSCLPAIRVHPSLLRDQGWPAEGAPTPCT